MSEEKINKAILTLDTLIDCCKEDGTYYTAQKEWEALEVFKQLQQENTQLKSVLKEIREYVLAGRYGEEEDYESISLYMPDLLKIIDKGIGE
jgi:hypothetical protein